MNAKVIALNEAVIAAKIEWDAAQAAAEAVEPDFFWQVLDAVAAGQPVPAPAAEAEAAFAIAALKQEAYWAAHRAAEAAEAALVVRVGYPKNGGPWKYGA